MSELSMTRCVLSGSSAVSVLTTPRAVGEVTMEQYLLFCITSTLDVDLILNGHLGFLLRK